MTDRQLAGMIVLVLDDESAILQALDKILRWMGAEVHTAENPDAARQILDRRRVDVLVCDMQLGPLSYREALPLLLAEDPDLKVLLTSGLPEPDSDYAFLAKPYSPQQLADALLNLS